MSKTEYWQFDNLTMEEADELRQRNDLPCAICEAAPGVYGATQSDETRTSRPSRLKPDKRLSRVEKYCEQCYEKALADYNAAAERNWRETEPFGEYNLLRRRAKAAAKKRGNLTFPR